MRLSGSTWSKFWSSDLAPGERGRFSMGVSGLPRRMFRSKPSLVGDRPSRMASQSANGGSPARSMYATTPAAHASTLKSYGRRLAISGDRYAYVPHCSVSVAPIAGILAAKPKSESLSRFRPSFSRVKRKLAGLTSRWTTPCSWHAASARSMPRIIGAAVASEKGVQHSPTQLAPSPAGPPPGLSSSSVSGTRTALSSSSVECATDAPESKSPPSQRSMRRWTPASSSKPSCRVTMSSDAPRAKCRETSSRTFRSQMLMASPVGV
mmetsp:Transcript_10331/g.42764  ORF Transcript_10331/g.42764 Transcript_10331/m.42764 type:complete len:265 (-) Transcript_10331:369-1163(-)